MRIGSKTATVVLTLVTGLAAAGASEAGATGSTGGASAPSESAPAGGRAATSPTAGSVRPSGVATWFGPGFYGKKTACGQTLTPSVVGVANRTLPCGTLVKVAYKNRTVTLPVLDRGPYSHIADWDLTAGAARALGVSDTVRIKTRVVGLAPNTPTLGQPAAAAQPATVAGGAAAG
jgi:rare lipoprotein A